MGRTDKYELIYIKLTWAFIVMGALIFSIEKSNSFKSISLKSLFPITILITTYGIFNLIKYKLVKDGAIRKKSVFITLRIIEIIILLYFIEVHKLFVWIFILVLLMFLTHLGKGNKFGLALIIYTYALNVILRTLESLYITHDYSGIIDIVAALTVNYLGLALCGILGGIIFKDNNESEEENKQLVNQLNEKYVQLTLAQNEVKYHYETLKETNIKLEDTNKKLTINIAEFFTLQQISQAISSIFDINELLKHVNDIIIGVMGVNYSTIMLFDEKKNRLSINTTNIKSKNEMISLNDNIGSSVLMRTMYDGKPFIENHVDANAFTFTKDRNINSIICLPLRIKSRKLGLVLLEQKYFNAFDDENIRLLGIIGQQVGIAMENAELYQKMQEMARSDSLTGIYNRMYFQERLENELKRAQEKKYNLSLAIFDIDNFKKFNDTYGHLFGDKVLKSITESVSNLLRSSDVFARYGGEEFIILFPRTKLGDAYLKADELRQKISKLYVKDDVVSATVTVSFGVSGYPENAQNENELIRFADDALYEAKAAGRNCVILSQQ